jgi:hypothetical protein
VRAVTTLFFASLVLCGCVAGGSAIPHADSPAVANTDAGPELCRDGTTPPCNDRD